MSYEDYIKKWVGNDSEKEEESSAKQTNGGGYESYIAKWNPTVDESYINSFLSDFNSYSNKAQTDYDGLNWSTATSSDLISSYKDTSFDLAFRAGIIKSHLWLNRDDIDEDEYNNMVAQLDDMESYSKNVTKAFSEAGDYYSQWETQQDYDDYVAYQKDYEEKKNFDLDAGQKEIDELKAIEDEYSRYSFAKDRHPAIQEKYQQYFDQYGDIKSLKALISEKTAYLNQAKRIQEGITLSGVVDNADFEANSGYVSTESDSRWDKLLGKEYDTTYEYVNNRDGFRDEYKSQHRAYSSDNPWSDGESTYEEKGYDYLNENEIAIYNYYYAKEGKDKAQEYLDNIQETLNLRKATSMYGNMEDKTALELAFGIVAGLDQFESGIKNLFNTEDDYIAQTAYQMASGMVREDLADVGPDLPDWLGGGSLGQMGYDAITTTANMVPSIMTSMAIGMVNPIAGKVVGTGLMGASAAGNDYQQMLNLGYSKEQARMHSALVGASEAGLQYFLGGIGALGGEMSHNVLTKIMSGIDNAFLRTALKLAGNMASEGLEEGLQEILTPWFTNLVMHTDEDVNWSEVAYSSLLGALTAGFMEGRSTISGEVGIYKTGRQLQDADITAQRLAEIGSTLSADTVAYQLAGRVNEKTGAYTMGRLFYEIGAEVTEQNKADIQKSLVRKGMSEGVARKNAEIFAEIVAGGTFSDAQIAIIEANEALAKTVNDIIINPNSTVNQRSKGYNEVLMALAKEKTTTKATSTEQAKTSGAKASSVDNVDTQNENGSEVDTSPAKAKSFASIKKGEVTIKLEDGSEVNLKEADLDPNEGVAIETIASIEGISAEDANFILNTLRTTPGTSMVASQMSSLGAKEAYKYGYYGFSEDHITRHGVFANSLTETQRKAIYKAGQETRAKHTADKQATVAKNATTANKVDNKGRVHFEGDRNSLKGIRKESFTAMEKIAETLGLQIYVFKSYVNEDGKLVYKDKNGVEKAAPNGRYEPSDSSIHIDINAGAKGQGFMLFTLAHELTHHIRKWSPAKFKILADFLMEEYGKKGVNVDALVRMQMDKAKRNGRTISYDTAYEEVVADSMEAMLADGNVMNRVEKLKAKDKDLWYEIKRFVNDFAEKIRKAYKGLTPDSVESMIVSDMGKAVYKLQELFAEALVDASENHQASLTSTESDAVSSLGENAEVETNAEGELLLAANEQGNVLMYSERTYLDGGREKLEMALRQNGHTEAEITKTLSYVDDALDYIKILAAGYAKNMGYTNLSNHLVADIVTNVKTGKQVMSAIVNNGDYPVNIDLSLICKKRVAYMNLMSRLIRDGVFDKVNYDGAAIAEVNGILRENGFETACLGCFVESRRLQFQTWAETIVSEWNAEVEKRNPNARHFGFAKGKMEELTDSDIDALTRELESVKKNDQGNVNLGQGNSVTRMGRLLDALPSLQKKLTVEDLLTPEGLTALRKHDGSLFSIVKSRYGAASPKIVQDFNPYASEIAMLTFAQVKSITNNAVKGAQAYVTEVKNEYGKLKKNKGESKTDFNQRKKDHEQRIQDEAMRRYLYDIGGARIQSFSDFMIENIFDYIQIFADLAAKRLPLHGYTKEIVCMRLFGMTGAKWNGSLIAHVERSMGKEFAGLLPAGTKDGIPVRVNGKDYVIGFDDYARNAATGGKSFIQSIGMKDVIALQLDPRYSPYVGNITIGVSDAQILAMLDSPLFRMVIPYHASGMLPMFAKLVGVDMYNDYTDYQNTTVRQYYDLDGNAVSELKNAKGETVKADTSYAFNAEIQKTKDAKTAANNYLNWCAQRHPVYDGSKLVGYATFNPKFSSSPYGTDFTRHENYYKLLEDFNTYDCITEASTVQGAVTMNFPSEENRLTDKQMAAYKKALRDTGIFTEKDIEKYSKKADMTFKEIIAAEVGNRANYAASQNPKWESTVKEVEAKLQKDYAREVKHYSDRDLEAAVEGIQNDVLTDDANAIAEQVTDVVNTVKFSDRDQGHRDETYSAIGKELLSYEEGNKKPDLTLVETVNDRTGKTEVTIKHYGQKPKDYVPKKIAYCYKLFEQHPDGTLHALFAGAKGETPIGVWQYAQGFPYTDSGVKGMNLRERYGWHLSAGLPAAPHLMSPKDFGRGYPSKNAYGHPKGSKRVWVRMAYDASTDFNAVADSTKEGDIFGLIPFGGYYAFKENNQSEWVISSAVKIDKILKEEERQQILRDAGFDEYEAWRKKFRPTEEEKAESKRKSAENKKAKDKAIKAGLNYLSESSKAMRESIKSRIIDNPEIMYSDRENAPTFYSQMAKVVDGVKQEKLGASSVVSMLRGKGVKAEEIKWSGIEDWLEGKKSVTKAELQEFIAGSMLQIEEETLTDKEMPYSQEHLDQIAQYEAERDIIAENLKSEWKRIVGTDIPIRYFGGDIEHSVVDKLLEANTAKKMETEAGYKYKAARAALQRCIEYSDHYFGFDNERQAFREAVRNPKDFLASYEMTSFEESVFRDFIKAKEAYSKVDGIPMQDQKALKAIAESADRFNRRIAKVKSEHRAEAAKHMTKWGQYKINGGENYREVLFKMPGSSYYNAAMDMHWGERNGVLAHARIQDLNTFLGKMLFIEEIQSDWHNDGRKDGYASEEQAVRKKVKDLEKQWDSLMEESMTASATRSYAINEKLDAIDEERNRLESKLRFGELAPDAPFKDTYHEYVLKRLLREAAENDYDSIGWTPAEIQVKRWSKKFEEGYRIEYDQDIPKFLNKYGKKWGTKVGKTVLDNGTEVWSMAITDEMKDSVLTEGQPLYSDRDYQNVVNKAIETFGTTTDFAEAGFILPNGKMLKFTDDNHSGERQYDHRAIGIAYGVDVDLSVNHGFNYESNNHLNDFVENGGIRFDPGSMEFGMDAGMQLSKSVPITKEQEMAIRDFVEWKKQREEMYDSDDDPLSLYDGPLTLHIDFGGGSEFAVSSSAKDLDAWGVKHLTYEGGQINASRIIADIRHYYRTGETRQQSSVAKFLYSERDTESVSNRSLLANAFEGLAQNDIERNKIRDYKSKIDLINAEERKLSELNQKIKDLSFSKGPRDTQAIRDLQFEAKQTANRINTYDKQLLRLEASKPLQDVLAREKKIAYQRAEKKGKEALEKYREKSAKTQRELLNKWQESREKGIDSRHRTAMRHKIKDVVSELNQYLLRGTKDRHVPESLQKAVAEALNVVNMDTVGAEERIAKLQADLMKAKTPDEIQEISRKIDRIREMGDKMNSRLQKLKDAYDDILKSPDENTRNSYDVVIHNKLDSVINKIGDTPLRDMTLEQLEDVYDMYKMVLKTIRDVNKSFKDAKKQSISTRANAVMAQVEEVGGKHKMSPKILNGIKKFGWNNLKPVYAFEHIGSVTLTEAFNNVRAGEDVWALDVTEARDFYLDKAKKYKYDSWNFQKQYRFTSTSEMDFSLNLEQIMSLYAYSKRKQAGDHLKYGGIVFDESTKIIKKTKLGISLEFNPTEATAYNISEETLADIISKLDDAPGAKEFVDEMQDYLSTVMGAKGNEVSMAMYDVRLFKEKNYFPLKSAQQFMEKAREQQKGDVKVKNSGFAKETTPGAKNPIVLTPFMEVWSNHVNEMSMYHAFVLPLEDFYRIYNYKTPSNNEKLATEGVNECIQNAYERGATAYIDQLLKDLNGGARTDSTTGFINKMMGLFKKGAVFASMSVVVQQPSAIARAAALVDTKYFIGPKVDHKRHKALWDEVKQYAPVAIIKEMGYFDTNMGKSTQDFILGKEYSGFKEKMKALVTDSNYRDEALSKAPALADEIAWCGIWEAVKREVNDKIPGMNTKSEEFLTKCGERFTDVIVKTQVYDSVLSRSGLMRSRDTGMKMATAFMAEPTTSINMIADALLQGKRGRKKYARSAIGAVIASQILNSILVSFVYAGRDEDEDKTYLEKYIGTLAGQTLDSLNPAGYIPFIKDIMSIVQGYDVERSDMAVISDLWKAYENLSKDYISPYRKVEGFAGSIAQIFGLPVKNIMRDARGIYQTIDSFVNGQQTTKAGIGYSIRDAITGKAVSNDQQLYEAILSGDQTQISRVKGRFEDASAVSSAIRRALRENDPRIHEAAVAWNANDLDEYMRIAREIIAEKNFVQDDVVMAIRAEANSLIPDDGTTSTSKAKGLFTMEKFAEAISQGDQAMANAIKSDIIQTAQKNGKSAEEAEKSFNSSAKTDIKELYLGGGISESKAISTLVKFCGMDQEDAEAYVDQLTFERRNGYAYSDRVDAYISGKVSESELRTAMADFGGLTELEIDNNMRAYNWMKRNPQYDLTVSEVLAYTKTIENYGLSIEETGIDPNVFVTYRDKAGKCTGIDADGDGQADSGTKKAEIMAVIDSLPITYEQKDALYYLNGWARSRIREAPWH